MEVKCVASKCDRPVKVKKVSLCGTHYQRFWKYGDYLDSKPLGIKRCVDTEGGMRTCTQCNCSKPFSEYYSSKTGKGGALGITSKCKQCASKNKKQYRKDNLEKVRQQKRNGHQIRRANKKSNGLVERISIKDFSHKDKCFYCGCKVNFSITPKGNFNPSAASIDHMIPLSRGGSHTFNNLVLSCLSCNISKGNKTVVEYINFLFKKLVK